MVVREYFAYRELHSWPQEMPTWAAYAERLKDEYCAPSKQLKQRLSDVLQHLNGDISSLTLQHWCLVSPCGERCCIDRADSLATCTRVLLAFFAGGFQTPLLYRFKHYDEAASFLRFGCLLHNILARTLQQMVSSSDSSSVRPLPHHADLQRDPEHPDLNDVEDFASRTGAMQAGFSLICALPWVLPQVYGLNHAVSPS